MNGRVHFTARGRSFSLSADWAATFSRLVTLRGNLLPKAILKNKRTPPKKTQKGAFFNYKMESVNKRHFQGTTFTAGKLYTTAQAL